MLCMWPRGGGWDPRIGPCPAWALQDRGAVIAGWGQVLPVPALALALASDRLSCLGQREEFWTQLRAEMR